MYNRELKQTPNKKTKHPNQTSKQTNETNQPNINITNIYKHQSNP